MMNLNDAILLAAIGLMLYGIAQHFLQGDDFWLSPIGNVIGAIGVTVVTGACFDLALQDEFIIFVAVALGLYWFTKHKAKPTKRQTFEQVFETVEVKPTVEPKVKAEPVFEQFIEGEPEPVVEQPFTWQGA